jgi:AraC-like DNA-binding protein
LLGRFGQVLVFLLIDDGLIIHAPILLKLFSPLYYTVPAFIYLYTLGFVNNRTSLRKIDYLHFLPGLIAMIDDIPWYLSPSINWNTIAYEVARTKNISIVTATGIFPIDFYLFARPVMLTIYLLLAFNLFFKSELFKLGSGIRRTWLLSCLLAVAVFHVVSVFTAYSRANGLLFYGQHELYLWTSGFGFILFLFVLWILILNPKILYGYILMSVGEKNNLIEPKPVKVPLKSLAVRSDAGHDVIQSAKNYMMNEKPFLKSDFQIIDLAHHLKMPTHQCSAMINNMIGKNFRDWINYYRIDHFIKTYPEKSQKLTIDGIAFESGFSSMTTFYRAFKKETGKMPSTYFPN